MSQSYVVALEGSRSSRDATGPSPTIGVLAGLATALETEPSVLIAGSLLRSGPHVLVVVEDETALLSPAARSVAGDVDLWVSAGARTDPSAFAAHLPLRPDADAPYDLAEIGPTIDRGVAGIDPAVEGRRLGLVFSETPSVLVDETDAVLAAEREWSAMVSRSVWAAGAHPAWNLCVYELDVLRRTADPFAASLDLIRSHDTVWMTSGTKLHRERAASMRLLQQLRPNGAAAAEWRRFCSGELDRISAN